MYSKVNFCRKIACADLLLTSSVAPNCWHQFQAQMAAPKTLKEREEKEDVENTETEREGEGRWRDAV